MFHRIHSFTNEPSAAGLLSLPVELLVHEFLPLLDVETLTKLLLSSKKLNELSMNNIVWETMLKHDFTANWPSLLTREDYEELEAQQLGSPLQPRPGTFRKIYSWLSVPEVKFVAFPTNGRICSHTVKLTVLGSSGVGKTSLIERGIMNQYRPYDRCNVGCAFWSKQYRPLVGLETSFEDFPDKPLHSVGAQFWDTAGQERFRNISPFYYRGTNATLLCFSIAARESFEALEREWIPQVKAHSPEYCQLVLVGLKCDLPDSQRRVHRVEARALAAKLGCKYMECSAKEDINVSTVLAHVVTRAVESLRRSTTPKPRPAIATPENTPTQQSYIARAWSWIKSILPSQ